MFVRKLSIPVRLFVGVVSMFSAGMAGLCGYLAATETSLPLVARIGLGTGVLFGLAWTALTVKVVRSGEINFKGDARRAAQMVWVFTVLMVVFFLVVGLSAEDRLLGILMVLQALAFLIGAAVYWLSYRIEAAELSVTERLLQLELQLAELAEKP